MTKLNDKTLINKLLKAANEIHNKTKKGSSNFIIVNSQVAEILNELSNKMEKRKLREKKIKRLLYEKTNNDDNNDTV